MLADQLINRARRCAELNTMLESDPKDRKAGDWVAEIAEKALSRGEERHVAIVRQVRHLRHRIAATEAMTAKDDTDRIADLKARRKAEPARAARFEAKIGLLRDRVAGTEANVAAQTSKIPVLRQRIARFMSSPELITKEDLING